MVIDAPITENLKSEPETRGHSVSSKLPCAKDYDSSHEDPDLWLAFLTEAGLIQASETGQVKPSSRRETNIDSPESILRQLNYYNKTPAAADTSTLRDDYEDIHRLCPGLFHDTIAMDNPKEAFQKAKRIIRDIINSQNGLAPMFDIDFANNLHCYPTVEQKLEDIRKEIAPRQIFY